MDRIARSEDAVFAFDSNDLIILWNKACERLLGRPAYQVLGRRCFDVFRGRDVYGNRYCCRSCPISDQARQYRDEALQEFLMDIPVGDHEFKRLAVTTFTIRTGEPTLSTIVHVLRDPAAETSALERELADAAGGRPAPTRRPAPASEDLETLLTPRERQILGRMARGETTVSIAAGFVISPVTVRNHIARILLKLDVHTKLAAVAYAYHHSLAGPDTAEHVLTPLLPLLPLMSPAPPNYSPPTARAPRPRANTPASRKTPRKSKSAPPVLV